MLFNSYGFVFAFFPLLLVSYYACKEIAKNYGGERRTRRFGTISPSLALLLASLLFYSWKHPEYLPVLLGSMAVNYLLFYLMERYSGKGKKAALIVGLVFNLGLLFVFKYRDTGGFVPLGISFFTFTQIAFLMERYRGNLKKTSILSYGLYVSFFPKVMQGPIALPGELLPQFEDRGSLKDGQKGAIVDWEQVYRGLYLFVLGLFKKVLIADTLGKAADFGYANLAVLNSGDALIVMLSYTLQLYFDFSGYCDMAMGIAQMMGFRLPLNFDSPYKAANIMEFWDRWHITLTRFFTKYLYIPLGGNRKGRLRTYGNCLLVFLVSGIWHGAGGQFVIWGLMHGVLFVLTRIGKDFRKDFQKDFRKDAGKNFQKKGSSSSERKTGLSGKTGHALCMLLTFLYVNIAWIFFRAPSVKEAVSLLKTIGSFSFGRINWELAGSFNLDEFWYVIKVLGLDGWQYAHYILMVLILAAVLLLVFFGRTAVSVAEKAKPGVASALLPAVLFVWSVLSFSGVSSFLYVNF